jgi:hypothetical protein
LSSRARLACDRELDNRTRVDGDVCSLRDRMPIGGGLVILGAEDEFLSAVAFACEAWIRLRCDIERRGSGDWKGAAEGGTRALQQILRDLRFVDHGLWPWLGHTLDPGEFRDWPLGWGAVAGFDNRPRIAEQHELS